MGGNYTYLESTGVRGVKNGKTDDFITLNDAQTGIKLNRITLGTVVTRENFGSSEGNDCVFYPPQEVIPPDNTAPNLNYIIYGDKLTGLISVYETILPGLSSYNDSGIDKNRKVQLGFFRKISGVAQNLVLTAVSAGNLTSRLNDSTTVFSSMNSDLEPVIFTPNGTNLTVYCKEGKLFTRHANFSNPPSGNYAPDLVKVPEQAAPLLAWVDRLNQIRNLSTQVNVTQYESSDGVYTTFLPNQAGVTHLLTFASLVGKSIFHHILLQGTKAYANLQAAIDSGEEPPVPSEYPLITAASRVNTVAFGWNSGAPTDLSDPNQAKFLPVKRFT